MRNSDLDCILPPLPLFKFFFGSLCCNLCPCAHSKPACTLQYATWTWHRDPTSPMPQSVNVAKTPNKEKSHKKYLESQCSDQWRKHLELTLSDLPGRMEAYVHRHLHNKHTRSMYKPAPYLTHQSYPYQLELLRIRTQHTIHIIPSHLHYAFRTPRADYKDRVCPHSLHIELTTCLATEFVRSRQCASTFSLQVPNSCIDLDLTLLYISILRTHIKFVRKNKMLALGVCFPQPCSSDGRSFAASRSRLNYYHKIGSFPQEIRRNAL